MASPVVLPADDKDLDDAALWAVIDSAAAAASHSSSNSRKNLAIKCSGHRTPSPVSIASPPLPRFTKNPRSHCSPSYGGARARAADGEVLQERSPNQRSQKFARSCVSGLSESSSRALAVVKHVQRTPATPAYSSSPETGRFSKEFEISPFCCPENDENQNARHSLCGQFPSISLFKEYQNAAMAILERTDYVMVSGNPYIKKSGWRKISFYFNLSYEIKDKTIEFDENRNVQRAEFVVRAYMQGGRFSDGWGSCDRREKRFMKPNHDVPSTAETRAKNKACQDTGWTQIIAPVYPDSTFAGLARNWRVSL